MRRSIGLLVGALCITWAVPALADKVTLRDDSVVEGKILTQKPGEYVIIELPTGAQRTLIWASIKDVVVDPPPAATAPTPAPTPTPTPTPEPAPAPPAATTPPPAPAPPPAPISALTTSFGGPTPPKDKPVAAPPKDAPFATTERHKFAQFVLAVPMWIGTTDGMSVYGVGGGIGLRLHAGSSLPTQGRSKNHSGFYLEGRATINYQKATQKIPEQCGSTGCLGPQEPEDKSFSFQGGGHAGYEFMHFGDVETNESGQRRQSGFGFSLGFFAGYFSSFGNLASSAMYGPVIGFGRHEYDPVTGRVESLKLDFMVLPMPTFTQYTFGVTAAFG